MARIAGVNIPTGKRVVIALQYIHGIGAKFAQEIVEKTNIPAERRVNQLSDAEIASVITYTRNAWGNEDQGKDKTVLPKQITEFKQNNK